MRPLPPLPDWLQMEHKVAEILTQQEINGWYFDERGAQELESTEESWKKLLTYFEDNSLTLQERCSLLNEITHGRDT